MQNMLTKHPKVVKAMSEVLHIHLIQHKGNEVKASKSLNISRTTLRAYIKLYGLDKTWYKTRGEKEEV